MLRVILCNCTPAESKTLARALIGERLAACVNIIPAVTSIYRWQGEICEETEDTLLIKTTPERYRALKIRLVELHSYEVPEVIALDSADVLNTYANWAHEQTT